MMRILTILISIMLLSMVGLLAQDQCVECHADWEEESGSPSSMYHLDVHAEAGLGCADCHGGDPALDDMDDVRATRGWKGVPSAREIPAFCASCHADPSYMVKHNPSLATDQLDKYKTSKHGQLLLRQGDSKAANCVSCHSVHNIQSPEIPTSTVYPANIPGTCANCHADPGYMKQYGISTTQYDDYRASVHGQALFDAKDMSAPACNDCHGNHGATPPGVESISAVCGTCHALIADKFSASPHKEAFDERDYPECESCHSNHRIDKPNINWVGTSDEALCVRCHKGDDGTVGLETAGRIHQALVELSQAHDEAGSKIGEADEKGMMVVDERFELKEVSQALIKAKTMVHTFNADSVISVTGPGIEQAGVVALAGQAKIDDYFFRRKGLGIATLFMTLLAVALYFKIKQMDKD